MTPVRVILIFAIMVIATACDKTHTVIASPLADGIVPVVQPKIPATASFCGRDISFDRTDMYERLDRELTSLAFTHGNTLLLIKRANRFFPIIAPILKKNGIPADMVYLACVESMLNIRALSPAKAAGLWQFMPETARQYGLEVNEWVDERYHVEKATMAACRYLKDAFNRYGCWENVAASYNAGMQRISSELEKQGVTSAFDLYLVDETSRYTFRIIATKLILENPQAYGFSIEAGQLYTPVDYDQVEVDTPVDDWAAWAMSHGTNYMTLREHNPWIRARSLPNKNRRKYVVKIPEADSLSRSKSGKKTYNSNWVRR